MNKQESVSEDLSEKGEHLLVFEAQDVREIKLHLVETVCSYFHILPFVWSYSDLLEKTSAQGLLRHDIPLQRQLRYK